MSLEIALQDAETIRILLASQLPALDQQLAKLDVAQRISPELLREPFGPKGYRTWDELRDAKTQYR